jgi:putative monooxygenase
VTALRPTKVAARDVAPNRRRGGDIRVLLSPKSAGSTSGFMGVLFLDPGEYVAEHYHPYSEEFLYVARGEVTVRVNGEPITLREGEAVLVPIEARHRVENSGPERAEVVLHLGPLAPRPELGHVDTEPLPNAGHTSIAVGDAP